MSTPLSKAYGCAKRLVLVLWLGWGSVNVQAAQMQAFTIDLPRHEIRFRLPPEIVDGLGPGSLVESFDPAESGAFSEQGLRRLAYTNVDFNGPFWVGAYGSLQFFVVVHRRQPGFDGVITSAEGLEEYVRWWWKSVDVGNKERWRIAGQATLNGSPAVLREVNEFGTPGVTEPGQRQLFSLPLDDQHFLDVGFAVMQWKGGVGKEKKWLPRAQAMRDALKASVVVIPRQPPPSARFMSRDRISPG